MKKNVGNFIVSRGLDSTRSLDLVWEGIVSDLRALSSIWWEHPEIVAKLCAFRRVGAIQSLLTHLPLRPQSLFSPVVQRLGYEFSPSDSADTTELRRHAIDEAARAGDEKYALLV